MKTFSIATYDMCTKRMKIQSAPIEKETNAILYCNLRKQGYRKNRVNHFFFRCNERYGTQPASLVGYFINKNQKQIESALKKHFTELGNTVDTEIVGGRKSL